MTTDHYHQHRDHALRTVTLVEEFDLHGPTHLTTLVALAQVHATLALAAATHDQVLVVEDSTEFDDDVDAPVPYQPTKLHGLPDRIAIIANDPQEWATPRPSVVEVWSVYDPRTGHTTPALSEDHAREAAIFPMRVIAPGEAIP